MKLISKVLLFVSLSACSTAPVPKTPMAQCAELCENQDVVSYKDRSISCSCNTHIKRY